MDFNAEITSVPPQLPQPQQPTTHSLQPVAQTGKTHHPKKKKKKNVLTAVGNEMAVQQETAPESGETMQNVAAAAGMTTLFVCHPAKTDLVD